MTLRDVLTETERRGIRLESRDGRLRYEAPQGTITADLRAALVAYKRDLVAIVWRLEEMRRLAVQTPRSCAYARNPPVVALVDVSAAATHSSTPPRTGVARLATSQRSCITRRSDRRRNRGPGYAEN
jgi:hypothetical protein